MGNRLVNWLAAAAMLAVALPDVGGVFRQRLLTANVGADAESSKFRRSLRFCEPSLARAIPERPASAPRGSEFAHEVMDLDSDAREAAIRDQLLTGNVPVFLRQLQPITLTGTDRAGAHVSLTVCVSPDYLAIGSDEDFLLTPMRLETALAVAEHYGFTLPTPKLVDAIYAQSTSQLLPQPLHASSAMRSTRYYLRHDELVRKQRERVSAITGRLISGHKKDLVLTNRLWRHLESVAIYGWHRGIGAPIQPLSTVHGWRYADYSHGVRLVSAEVFVNGQPRSIYSVMADPELATLLSGEGVMPRAVELIQRLTRPEDAAAARQPRSPDTAGPY